MKLGEVSDSVNSISFRVQLGFNSPGNVEKESSKVLTFIDKTTETIDYGARKIELSTFNLVDIANDDYVTLIDYLDDNQGQIIKIEEELSGENIFTTSNSFSSYYVFLISYSAKGEQDFSQNRSRFNCELNVSFVGQNSTDKYNSDDSSLIDILIEVDTIRANYIQSTGPVASEGERWLDTDDNKLYKYIDGAWRYLYDVMSDNPSYGFLQGKFYWSLFSDISQDLSSTPDNVNNNHISGFINKKSMRLPSKSINLFNGPTIAYKKGFSFSVRNIEPFWNWVIQNNISLYGSKITLYLFNNTGSNKYLTKIGTGINNNNSFSYKDYAFKVEPLILNDQSEFNNDLIDESESRYTDIRADFANKAPYRTFGIWDKAALQNVSKQDYQLTFDNYGSSTRYVSGTQTLDGSNYTDITVLAADYVLSVSDISLLNSNPEDFAIYVVSDTNSGSDNVGESSSLVSFNDTGTTYIFSIATELPTDPSSSEITFQVTRKSFIYQATDDPSLGYNQPLDVYTYNNEKNDIVPLPSSSFNINQNYNGTISVSSDQSINLSGVFQYASTSNFFPNIISNTLDALNRQDQSATYPYDSKTYNPYWKVGHTSSNPLYSLVAKIESNVNNLWGIRDYSSVLGTENANSSISLSRNTAYPSTEILVDNGYMFGIKFPVSHSNDLSFKGKNEYRLCFDFDAKLTSYIYDLYDSYQRFSYEPIGIDIVVRFKKTDGTYIDNNNWKISINRSQSGVSSDVSDIGKFKINNFPDGDNLNGGFGINPSNNLSNFDFIIKERHNVSDPTIYKVLNDIGYRDDSNFFVKRGNRQLQAGYTIPVANDKILHLNTQDSTCDLYSYTGSGLVLTTSDYSYIPTITGRDLFDITELFEGANPPWDLVESMELLFLNKDFTKTDHNRDQNGDLQVYNTDGAEDRRLLFGFDLNRAPVIYYADEFDLTDRKLFCAFTGPDLGTNEYSDAGLMVKYILNESYGSSNYVSSSVDTLMTNKNWVFRKQFYDKKKSDQLLKEILWATFSCAIYNENDQIELKSLSESDYNSGTTLYDFNDSDIIDGSFSVVKMRNSDEIFQKFELNYDFYPPGKFSSSIEDYKGNKQLNYSNPLNNDLKLLIKRSEALFENQNDFKKNIEYHYNSENIDELINSIARYFLFNAWEVSFKVSISNFLNGNYIDYMDYISLTSNFFTNNSKVSGFVSNVSYDIYDGTVLIRMYIPNPPGISGPFNSDIFKDALYIANRDTTNWAANGQVNDAARVSTRSIGSYSNDEAGQISTRDFNTW